MALKSMRYDVFVKIETLDTLGTLEPSCDWSFWFTFYSSSCNYSSINYRLVASQLVGYVLYWYKNT